MFRRFAIKSALDWLSAMPSLVWMVLLIQFQVVKLLPILYKHSLTFQFFFRQVCPWSCQKKPFFCYHLLLFQFLFCFLLEQLIFPTAWDVTILGMVMSLMLRRLSSKVIFRWKSSRFCFTWTIADLFLENHPNLGFLLNLGPCHGSQCTPWTPTLSTNLVDSVQLHFCSGSVHVLHRWINLLGRQVGSLLWSMMRLKCCI